MATVGIYVDDGSRDLSNITASLSPLTSYLADIGHDVDLFGGGLPFDAADPRCRQLRSRAERPSSVLERLRYGYRACVAYCRSYSPDVLMQFWQFGVHAPALVAAGRRMGVPTILRFNGDVFRQYQASSGVTKHLNHAFNSLSRLALELTDGVFVFGPYGEKEVKSRGVSDDAISILPPSRDVGDRFAPADDRDRIRDELGLPRNETIALYVGRITDMKGMGFLKELISKTDGDVQFVLVGGGVGESENTTHEIARAFADDVVRAEGKVPHGEVHRYYQAADIYVHPSEFEGLPLTILEALECGTPVIARPAGDIPFIVPNIAETPEEMAEMLLAGEWDSGWEHKNAFAAGYHRSTLDSAIKSAIR